MKSRDRSLICARLVGLRVQFLGFVLTKPHGNSPHAPPLGHIKASAFLAHRILLAHHSSDNKSLMKGEEDLGNLLDLRES